MSKVIIRNAGNKKKEDAVRIVKWAIKKMSYITAKKILQKQYNILIILEV